MCGILGSINRHFDGGVLDLLRHRGPDDWGITHDRLGGHAVTLAHRRLSIVDLSPAGHQPMPTFSGCHSIVFNGEVYNHQDLRSQLPGVNWRGHSDTETIVNYLAKHGPCAASLFNGIFALGILDKQERQLFLARDPFGVKPLYYWHDRNSFVFSSELAPLNALVEDSVDGDSLAELLRLRYLPAPDTLFRNIRKVRPGHILEVDLARTNLTIREYPFGHVDRRTKSPRPKDAVKEYSHLTEQAVRRQLMADVKIGIFLSGGVDSALVASLAQKHSSYPMEAFTVGFTGDEAVDEIQEAAESARILGLRHHTVRIGFNDFMTSLPRISAIVEEPLATTSMIPMYYLSSLASQYGKVMLSGQGVDESMGGYRRYRAERLRALLPRWAVPALRQCARLLPLRSETIDRGLASVGEADDITRFEAVYGVFSADQIERLMGYRPSRAARRIGYLYDLLDCSRQASSVERMMTLDLRMNLADDLLLYTDKITMRHSIECRVPLLDHDLVRFAESLPGSRRAGLFQGKLLHKASARQLLPASIVRRKKKGFLSPTRDWFRNTGSLREILMNRNSRFASLFDLREVDRILCRHASGFNCDRHIFLLLSICYWLEAHHSTEARALTGAAVH